MVEIVVAETKILKLRKSADLHRYFSHDIVVAQVQQSELGKTTNGPWNWTVEFVLVEVEDGDIKKWSKLKWFNFPSRSPWRIGLFW